MSSCKLSKFLSVSGCHEVCTEYVAACMPLSLCGCHSVLSVF